MVIGGGTEVRLRYIGSERNVWRTLLGKDVCVKKTNDKQHLINIYISRQKAKSDIYDYMQFPAKIPINFVQQVTSNEI